MSSQIAPITQRATRIPVDIAVHIVSVLSSSDATLRDLTEYGTLIEGFTLPKGTQFQIEYQSQTVYGFVIWAEHDRFGARFPFPLCEGPLHRRLEQARMELETRQPDDVAGFGSVIGGKRPAIAFGRRGIN